MGKKIGIELNDVLRAYTEQFIYVYRKFIDPAAELKTEDITDADFSKSFPFKNRDEYTNFRYIDYPFELHARADECSKGLNAKFNMWTGRDLINTVEKVFCLTLSPISNDQLHHAQFPPVVYKIKILYIKHE